MEATVPSPDGLQNCGPDTNLISVHVRRSRGEGRMTATAARFQPDADRYYAEGYWRPGDLWEDVAARVHEHPDRKALVLDDRTVTYGGLRKAAIAVSRRLAE